MSRGRHMEPHSLPPFLPPDPSPPTVVPAQSFTWQPAPPPPCPRHLLTQQQPREGRGRAEGGAAVAHGGHLFHATSPPTAAVAEGKATGEGERWVTGGVRLKNGRWSRRWGKRGRVARTG
ncbi:unnamed protein product [Closterium sp. Naga37s-1]|nr:unnamed protein product [Closterium sp. Naga37s-1]